MDDKRSERWPTLFGTGGKDSFFRWLSQVVGFWPLIFGSF